MISFDSITRFGIPEGDLIKITESFSISTDEYTAGSVRIDMLASYEGENAPELSILLTVRGQNAPIYESHAYRIGREKEYKMHTFRTAPIFLPSLTLSLSFNIPEGTALFIKNLATAPTDKATDLIGGPRHNAHLGLWGMAPDNTMPAFELAAASGFPACIAVPKVTKDGVIVCIHDDTINRTARDKDGNAPTEPIYVWDKTYEELCEWEYGSYMNEVYRGTRLPRLSEFFDLCARSGMRPMFSTHPGLTVPQWEEVKEMLKRRGLLRKFHIKSFGADILKTAYSVFGNEIEGYTFDVGSWADTHIETLLSTGIDVKASRVGIEAQFDHYTEEIAAAIRGAGLFASAWNIKRRKFSEYERLMAFGVTEFTEDYHCSMNLNY